MEKHQVQLLWLYVQICAQYFFRYVDNLGSLLLGNTHTFLVDTPEANFINHSGFNYNWNACVQLGLCVNNCSQYANFSQSNTLNQCKPVLFDLSLDAIKFSYFKCQMSKTDSSNSLNQILIFVLLYRYDLPFFSSPAYCLTISISCSKLWKQLDRITHIDRYYGTNIFILLQNLKLTNILKPQKKSFIFTSVTQFSQSQPKSLQG